MNDRLKTLHARKDELMRKINSAPGWGAAVGSMNEELQSVLRSIEYEEARLPQTTAAPTPTKRRRRLKNNLKADSDLVLK
jgi:hypothetical protein